MPDTKSRIAACLNKYLESLGRDAPQLADDTDLIKGLGLSSDDGLDLVLDMEKEFKYPFPKDFNPLVHSSNTRGMRFGELVSSVTTLLAANEVAR